MKYIMLLVMGLLLAIPAHATFQTPTQIVFNNSCAASTTCAVSVSAIGAGHLLVVLGHIGNNNFMTGVTAAGETFTVIGGNTCGGTTGSTETACAYVLKSVGGATTVTCNWNFNASASNTTCGVYEIPYTAQSVYLDGRLNNTPAAGTTFFGADFSTNYTTAITGYNEVEFQLVNVASGTISAIDSSFVLDNHTGQVADAHLLNTNKRNAPTWTNSISTTSLVASVAFGENYTTAPVAIPATTPASGMQLSYSGSIGTRLLTVIAPGQFELIFDEGDNWGVAGWYDLVNDPSANTNLLAPAYPCCIAAGPSALHQAQPGLFNRTYYNYDDNLQYTRAAQYFYPAEPIKLSILEYTASRVVIETKSEPLSTSATSVVNNVVSTIDYYIYPSGKIYVHCVSMVTNADTIASPTGTIFSDMTLEDPTQTGSIPPDSQGWIRSSTTQNPYSSVSGAETYLYAYWGPSTPAPYTNYTKASILMVHSPNNLHDKQQIIHSWGNPTSGYGVIRWGWYTDQDTISLGAGGSETEDVLIQLGTQGSTILPNINSSTVAGPIAAAYIANPTPPSPLSVTSAVNEGTTVQFTTDLAGAGIWSCAGTDGNGSASSCVGAISSGGVYTAPASVAMKQSLAGYQLLPNNHVFNQRIDSLSVNSSNATWMAAANIPGSILTYLPSFPFNYTTPSTATDTLAFCFTPLNNGVFQMPSYPTGEIEGGWLSARLHAAGDHHMDSIDTTTGNLQEIYQYFPTGVDSGCSNVNSLSGVRYTNHDYGLPANNATDAAGMFIIPLTLRLQETAAAIAASGTVNHAARITFAQGIECSCNIWPATTFATDGGTVPFGARARLQASYPIGSMSAAAQVIATQLKQYGVINSDGGQGFQVTISNEPWPITYSMSGTAPGYFYEVGNSKKSFAITNTSINGSNVATITANNDFVASQMYTNISGTTNCGGALNGGPYKIQSASSTQFTVNITHALCNSSADSGTATSPIVNYFEFVDESGMMLASTNGETNRNRETITFTRTSDSATVSADIALQGVAINFTKNVLNIMAGTPAQTLPISVTGDANTNFTCSMSPSIGSLSGCVYTAPASVVSATSTTVTATTSANGAVSAPLTIWVFPSTIRIVEASSDYTDSLTNVWKGCWGCGFSNIPQWQGSDQNDASFPNITDKQLYYNFLNDSAYVVGDFRADFLAPPGTYRVTYHFDPYYAATNVLYDYIFQGVTVAHAINPRTSVGQSQPFTFTTTATVGADNKLSFYIFGDGGGNVHGGDVSSISLSSGSTIGQSLSGPLTIKSGVQKQ